MSPSRPRRMPDLRAFLFDLDGTLVHTPIDFAGMKRSVLDLARGYGLDPDALAQYDILGIVEEAERALESPPLPPPFRREAERALTRYELEAAAEAVEIPGAISTLTGLKARDRAVGIVTRNCRAAVGVALDRVYLPHDLLLTRDNVARVKPHPDHLLDAARRLGAEPGRCAMIGDHPMDVQAARAAGMYAVGVQTRDPSSDAFRAAPPDLLLPGVGDLLPWMSASSSSTGTPAPFSSTV